MGKEINCPIWNTPALLLAGSFAGGQGVKMWSARAGGEYRYTTEAYEDYGHSLTDPQRAMITNWLVDQRRLGTKSPMLTDEVMETILKEGHRLRFSEKRERFWRAVIQMDLKPGEPFSIDTDYASPELMNMREPQILWAAMGVETDEEGLAMLRMLKDEGYLDLARGTGALNGKAFEKLEGMSSEIGHQAFVAMWFDPTMKEAWRLGFAPAIRDAGYDPFRIDGLQHNGKIDDAIVAEIKKSRFLIADFTCGGVETENGFQPNPRGGVYYEAGLAHGLGMEVIFTCREDRMQWLHFDTRQFAHIVWKTPRDLREQLYNRIAATLKEAPGAPGRGRGAVDPPENA